MKTISLLNMKGGCGKTTTSINIASGLAEAGYKTLLIDFDPQGNTTLSFGVLEPEYTIDQLLDDPNLTLDALIPINSKLDMIASDLSLSLSETKIRMNDKAPQHNHLKRVINKIKNHYDYCIIDCPPILNLLTVNIIIASDVIIVPVTPEAYAVKGLNITIDNINQIKENFELDLDYKVLITMKNRNNTEQGIMEEIQKIVKENMLKTTLRFQAKPIKTAVLTQTPVIFDKKAGIGEDYRHLVEELLEVI